MSVRLSALFSDGGKVREREREREREERRESMEALAIYHEKQVSQMCGVHCLNTLLQANAFNEVDLAQIAQELDRRERALMAEAGLDNEDYLKFVAADSQNVSDEGNFSIQVSLSPSTVMLNAKFPSKLSFSFRILDLGNSAEPEFFGIFSTSICKLARYLVRH